MAFHLSLGAGRSAQTPIIYWLIGALSLFGFESDLKISIYLTGHGRKAEWERTEQL